jgi:dTDP-4-dehydrorhamnose reductase
MKIMILGSSGTLGQELMKEFSDYDLIGFTKKDLDILDYNLLKNKIEKTSPNVIINSSAHTNLDAAEKEEKELAFKINAYAVENIAKLANVNNSIFIHFSTDYIFNGEKNGEYLEHEKANPINVYGESKYLGEKLIIENSKKYYIVRLSRLFGKLGKSDKSKKNFIDIMLQTPKEVQELEVGDSLTSKFTYTKDLAKAVKKLIEENYPFGTYHLTNEGACTFYDFAKEIFKLSNIDVKVIPVDSNKFSRPAKIPKNSPLKNTKFPKLRHWKDALEEYLKK